MSRLVALVTGILAAPVTAGASSYGSSDFPGFAAAFRLQGSNGYSISVNAYSEPLEEGERIFVFAVRKGSAAFYSAPVRMTATTISADLGFLGKVDLSLNPSGGRRPSASGAARFNCSNNGEAEIQFRPRCGF